MYMPHHQVHFQWILAYKPCIVTSLNKTLWNKDNSGILCDNPEDGKQQTSRSKCSRRSNVFVSTPLTCVNLECDAPLYTNKNIKRWCTLYSNAVRVYVGNSLSLAMMLQWIFVWFALHSTGQLYERDLYRVLPFSPIIFMFKQYETIVTTSGCKKYLWHTQLCTNSQNVLI